MKESASQTQVEINEIVTYPEGLTEFILPPHPPTPPHPVCYSMVNSNKLLNDALKSGQYWSIQNFFQTRDIKKRINKIKNFNRR